MDRIDPGFEACMAGHSLEELERHPAAVYGLWPDFRLAYFNPAWLEFAAANGGEPDISRRWPIGAPIMPAISPVMRTFYELSYRVCLEAGTPWTHEFECSSDKVFRRYQQTVYPLAEAAGLLVVNSLEQSKPLDAGDSTGDGAEKSAYRGDDGFVEQCANCRKVRYRLEPERWDWVPSWVRSTPRRVDFALCNACRGRYKVRTRAP